MCYDDRNVCQEREETWMDYMDEGEISGNGPDDDNIDPD